MTGSDAAAAASTIVSATRAFIEERGLRVSHRGLAALLDAPEGTAAVPAESTRDHGQLLRALESALGDRGRDEVYTPEPVARWLAEQLDGVSVFDPAAGTGRLLAAWLRTRVTRGADPARMLEAHVEGLEISTSAALVARASLVALAVELGAARLVRPRVRVADALELSGGDHRSVIMNPPFANADRLSRRLHEGASERWPFYRRQLDQSVLFMALAVDSLAEGGQLAAIVPRYWLEATGAERFRRWLVNQVQVEQLYDLGNVQVWPQVNVLTALVVLRRGPGSVGDTQVARIGDRRALERLTCAPATGPPASYRVDVSQIRGPWVVRHPDIERRVARIAECPVTVDRYFTVGQGLKSGRNRVFVMDRSRAAELGLPEELLRPTVKTRDIRAHRVTPRDQVLLRVGPDLDLGRYPALRCYLEPHREDLESRYQVRSGAAPWFALSLPQNQRLMGVVPKILSPLYARGASFAVDEVGFDVLTDVYVLAPRGDLPVSVWAVVALLNAEPMASFIDARAKLKRAGYKEFGGRLLRSLPLPLDADGLRPVDEAIWRAPLTQLAIPDDGTLEGALREAAQRLSRGVDVAVSTYVDRVAIALYRTESTLSVAHAAHEDQRQVLKKRDGQQRP